MLLEAYWSADLNSHVHDYMLVAFTQKNKEHQILSPLTYPILLCFRHKKINIAELRVPACAIHRLAIPFIDLELHDHISNAVSNISDIVLCCETFMLLIVS